MVSLEGPKPGLPYGRVAHHTASRRAFFLDSLLGENFRNFGNRLHSTRSIERYLEKKDFLWNTLFFSVKVRKKITRNLSSKKYLKNTISRKTTSGKLSPEL